MNPDFVVMAVKMKRLPRGHRIAHLRALIRQAPASSSRREELLALLRDEAPSPSSETGAR
jgi:hypothetical protein